MDLISNGYANLKTLALGTFPGSLNRVTNVVPVHYHGTVVAAAADFSFLAANAGHVYFVHSLNCWEYSGITGSPIVRTTFPLTGTGPNDFIRPNTSASLLLQTDFGIWCDSLVHENNAASAGGYVMTFLGFDITYS